MNLGKKKNQVGITILLILLAGFCLRLAFASTYLPLLVSETNHLPLARNISFSLKNFYLPLESGITNHLILTDLAVKMGLAVFGNSVLGLRFLFVLTGLATLAVIYKICLMHSKRVATYAVFLAAFNQYSIAQSGIADNPVLIVFFSALSIYVFWKVINFNRKLLWLLCPVWILAYLTQEQIVIFAPVFYLFLLTSHKYRAFAKAKEIIFSYLIFLGFVGLHLFGIKSSGTCLEYFSVPGYIQFSYIPTFTGLNFFLIRPISKVLNLNYLMTINWEIKMMSALSGVVSFSGVIYSLKCLKNEFVRLLSLLAVSQLLFFTFINSDAFIWGEPNWPKLSLIPAVCLAAIMLSKLKERSNYSKFGIYSLFIIIFFQALIFSFQPKLSYPPHRFATFADFDIQFIELYSDQEFFDKPAKNTLERMGIRTDYNKAVDECVRALNICPNEVRIHNYLAESLYTLNLEKEAEQSWLQALELEPFYRKTFESILATYGNQESLFYRGIIHFKQGTQYLRSQMFDEAIKEFKKAKISQSQRELFHYYLGIGYLSRGDLTLAEEELRKVLAAKSEFTRAYADLAKIFMLKGNLNEAEELLLKIIQANPDYHLAYEYLGQLYVNRGNSRLAKEYYKKAENIIHVVLKGDHKMSKLFP